MVPSSSKVLLADVARSVTICRSAWKNGGLADVARICLMAGEDVRTGRFGEECRAISLTAGEDVRTGRFGEECGAIYLTAGEDVRAGKSSAS